MSRTAEFRKITRKELLSLILLAAFLSGLSGCQSMMFNQGGQVSQENWISLGGDGKHSGVWNARDLSVDYQYARNGSELTLSGKVAFADLIKNSFVLVRYFHLSVIWVDGQGNVLGAPGLTSASNMDPEDPEHFSARLTVPGNALYLAFSYQGQAVESGGRGDSGSPSYFWHYPIH